MYKERKKVILLCAFLILVIAGMIVPDLMHAQYWAALPPYNLMWPLWSPALSPVDPATGLATPLISSLTSNTLLPVQPGLVKDPYRSLPWALYNTPLALGGGMLFFDITYGLNPFPPSYLLDSVTGTPNPIALPLGWSVYLPVALKGFEYFIPLANLTYIAQYGLPSTPFLTSADIWGYTPFSALPPAVF
ncbi:MAG: hypothetical protein ACMUIS_03860 [bacterium]